MKKINANEIGACISEALDDRKKNILFISPTLEYNNALKWAEEHPAYGFRFSTPGEFYEDVDGALKPTGIYMLANSELEALNNENAIWFFNAFSEKCVGGFEEILNVLKERYYVNKFPEGDRSFLLDKMALFLAFTTPGRPGFDDWSALDEKYYPLFDEIYYVD